MSQVLLLERTKKSQLIFPLTNQEEKFDNLIKQFEKRDEKREKI